MEGCVPIVRFPSALRGGLLGEWELDRVGFSLAGEGWGNMYDDMTYGYFNPDDYNP